MMTTTPDAPAIGSLWEHEDGERRFVTYTSDRVYLCRLNSPKTAFVNDHVRHSDWHAWAAKARRLA